MADHRVPFASRSAQIALATIVSAACTSPPASPLLEPLWTLDVAPPVNAPTIHGAGFADGSVALAVPTGTAGNMMILAYIERGTLRWSRELPTALDLAVSQNGRVHYLDFYGAGAEVHRIEPSGTELSALTVGPERAYLVAARDTAAIVVQYEPGAIPGLRLPNVVSISAANVVQWARTIDIGGRCLFAEVLRVRDPLVVVGGSVGDMVNNGCEFQSGNIWLAAISSSDGSLLWSQVASPTGRIRDVALTDDAIFLAGDFGRQALRNDGTELWWTPESSPNYSLTAIESISPNHLVSVEVERVSLISASDGAASGDFIRVPEAREGRVFFDGVDTLYAAGLRREVDDPRAQPAVAALRVNAPSE
jgi:hypothetical protein